MFTGIVTDIGTVTKVEQMGDTRVTIRTVYDTASIDLGASIACSGACMTVVATGPDSFTIDVSGESVSCTAKGKWEEGARLNLERALKLGDELGGHIVTGHVDGVGRVVSVSEIGGSHSVRIRVDAEIAPYMAQKGSVTVDGVSLTVNDVEDAPDGSSIFALNIIPHTWEVTALSDMRPGSEVNIEIDVLARYLARMKERLAG
jgi:riboflavin synthase